MIYINTDNVSGGIARLEELRAVLKEFHEESGKPIVSYAENYTNAGYYIASVSDKIMMNKFGESQVTGLATSMNFYKDLFDKLGVQIQLIRHGKYKSAGEPYIANHISDANREMTQEMLNSEWATITEGVCASRNIPVDSLNGYIDNLELLDAESMAKAFEPRLLSTSAKASPEFRILKRSLSPSSPYFPSRVERFSIAGVSMGW